MNADQLIAEVHRAFGYRSHGVFDVMQVTDDWLVRCALTAAADSQIRSTPPYDHTLKMILVNSLRRLV